MMIAKTSSSNGTGSLPAKRSLFNRPSWSKPEALTHGSDLFHRSNQTYIDHTVEEERQRKRKLARKERERARRAETEEHAEKRQRVSGSEDDDDDQTGSDESSHHSDDENRKQEANSTPEKVKDGACVLKLQQPKKPPKSLLKCYEAAVATQELKLLRAQKPHDSQIVGLENEEDSPAAPTESADFDTSSNNLARSLPRDEEPVSDEEFPELARQAREKARRKRLEEDAASVTPDPVPTSQDGCFRRSQSTYLETPPPPSSPPPDPVLQIFIDSSIPNTAPLIVNRKLSQRLKDVRLAWIERQHLPSDISDKIFLTWRGKRLFDVTSCRSLGINSGPNGRILAKGNNVVDHEGRIHMEAMTTEIFETYKKSKRSGTPKEEEDTVETPLAKQPNEEAQIKIICKAKGFDDFKLLVKQVGMPLVYYAKTYC